MRPTLLLAAILLLHISARAQSLRLLGPDGNPAGAVRISLIPADHSLPPAVLTTDNAGKASLPASGYPYRLVVTGMLYERQEDSVSGPWNKVIWLTTAQQRLGDVVITGQYAPNTRNNAVQRIEVIDRKKIDAMAAQNLRDVLTNQLDIRLSQDAIFGVNMSMQGSKSYGEDAKILIDGVPVIGKQNGAIDLSQISLANVERIEIVKGPMSVAYGTDAIAGTINLVTKKDQKRTWEGSAGTWFESIGTYNVNARTGFHKKRHTLLVDGARNFFDGWNPGDKPSLGDFSHHIADTSRTRQWKPREQYAANLQYIYTAGTTTFNYKSSYFNEVITNRGAPLLPYYEMAFDDYYHTARRDNALFINSAPAKNSHISFLLSYNAYKRVKNEYTSNLTTMGRVLTDGMQDTSKYNELNSRATFSRGAASAKISAEAGYDINLQYANSTQLLGSRQQMGNYALFASAEYKPATDLIIRPGVRYGHNTRYDAPVIPSLNLLYKANKKLSLRASYARGFRQPNLKELYFDFVDINHDIHGNPSLKAEYSDNYSCSADYTTRHTDATYTVSASSFYNNIENLISLASVTGGAANEYTYINTGRYKTSGVQLSAAVQTGTFSFSAGGSLTGTYNVLSEQAPVPGFSYSPELRGSISYTWAPHTLTAAAFCKYTGRFASYIADGNNQPIQVFTEGYTTADLTLSKTFFKKRLEVALGCKNLFDVTSIAAYGAASVHSSASGTMSISTGRYYFLKTQFNFRSND